MAMPDDRYADRGYDSEETRRLLARMGVEPQIAERGAPHGSGPGQVRWVVERTISCQKGQRRLRLRKKKARGSCFLLHRVVLSVTTCSCPPESSGFLARKV